MTKPTYTGVLAKGGIGAVVAFASTFGGGPMAAAAFSGVSSAAGNAASQGIDKGFGNIDGTEVVANGIVGAFTGWAAKGVTDKLIPNKNLPSVPQSAANVAEGRVPRMLAQPSSESLDKPVRDSVGLVIGTGLGLGTQGSNSAQLAEQGIDAMK